MRRSGLLQYQPGRLLRLLQGRAAAGQAGIRHEVSVRAERLRRRAHAPEGSLRLENPALRLVVEIGDHDLVEDLLVDRCVLDGNQGLDPAVQIAGHPVRRGDEDLGVPGRSRLAIAEERSEEGRGGKEGVRKGKSWWSP